MQSFKRKSCGGPLVVHAGEIYTANVHAMFCEIKDKSEFYRAIEVEGGLEYNVEHYNMEKVQRWCKGRYKVTVQEADKKYECECGLFEHFGLPCRHILRVSNL
jgi:hypothetical protein